MNPKSQISVSISKEGKEIPIKLFAVRNGATPLLGRTDIRKLGFQVGIQGKVIGEDDIVREFLEVFTGKVGKYVVI